MKKWSFIHHTLLWATVWVLFAIAPPSHAQQNSDGTEVYLSFQYRGVVSSYVTSYYKDDQFYLPISELFNQLKIQHQVEQGTLKISGNYLGETDFILDFDSQVARAGDTEIRFSADDFIIKEIDYFIRPDLFNQLFDLEFTTNFNNLTLNLETENKMPVVAQHEREQERERIGQQQPVYNRSSYPLQYDRKYQTLDGAFLDYNLSGVYTNNSQLFTFNNAVGGEILGGDVQGNIFGSLSNNQNSFTTNGLRWRYVQRDNDYFSSGIVGQTVTEGMSSRSITGFKISNKPVEPRLLFDRYVIDGNVTPQSEVELYLNNRLIDYQETDQSGNYRFIVPLTYGSTDYSVRIYRPSGQSIERNSRIQIPFDYVPPGEIDYSISGGQLDNPLLGSTERGYVGAASFSTGISDWLTAQASSEYLSDYHDGLPSVTGTLNARLLSNYLVSANINSENFYRLTSSVVYGNGASWSLSYDYNAGDSRIYNIGGNDQQARVNLFTPLQIGSVPLNMRWSTTYQQNQGTSLYRYRADLNTRLGRLNVRLGYQDQQIGAVSLTTTPSSRITNSYTYSIGRFSNIPKVLRGLFLRGQLSYLPAFDQFEEAEVQLSRDIRRTGRLQLTYGHNFLGGFNTLSLNLTLDFNKVRSNTTSRMTGSEYSVTQSLRGSLGYDPSGGQLLFNNRQQVGQAGAAVRLFVDNNNDGTYQEESDDIIRDPAVRLNRSGGQTTVKNGINYISQLLPYYQYDIQINKGALSNPLLVPDVENFSIITDPNQYKTIEIPFYLSGVISGRVDRMKDSTLTGVSGVRLYLESNDAEENNREPFSEEIRTFSDGSFYTYEVPPGEYNLFIDPNQLDFLDSSSKPDTMKVEVQSLAEGDFIENLNFMISPKSNDIKSKEQTDTLLTEKTSPEPTDTQKVFTDKEYFYQVQLASFKTLNKATQVAMVASQRLGGAFSVIYNSANGLYAIRGNTMVKRKQAVETILSYHNSAYKSAALVVLKNEQKRKVSNPSKFIQIGAFTTQSRAEDFADQSSKQLEKEIAITHHKKSDLYKVYINEKFSSDSELALQLTALKNQFSFSDSFINNQNNIQIGAFSNQRSAKQFAQTSKENLNLDIAIRQDPETSYFNVFIDGNSFSRGQKKELLSTIRNAPSSKYQDAFVSLFTADKTSAESVMQRPMKFTYQVQIEGVTPQSENAFLSSLLSPNSDTEVQQPEQNLVVFDKVSTWKEAQDLQRKLSKVSSMGHPIVILMEESSGH